MSKAPVGHAAFDAEADIGDVLSTLDTPSKRPFLEAAVAHAEEQRDILEDQYDRLVEKYETIRQQWEAKIDEAADMRDIAENTLEALVRDLDALGG